MIPAVVVFSDDGAHPLSRCLQPGFKHVFCCLQEGDYWICLDDAANKPIVHVIGPAGFDLAGFYDREGYEVISLEVPRLAAPKRWPLTPTNCVGFVKWVLGMRAPWVLTPYQLYRRLERDADFARGRCGRRSDKPVLGGPDQAEGDTAAGTRANAG